MLVVPDSYTEAYALLYSTPSGAAIIESAEVAGTFAVEVAALGAYGMAINPNTIHLTDAVLPTPHKACILAHELTHCLDMAFWNMPRAQWTSAMLGATEINAHYNHGLVAKEFQAMAGLNFGLAAAVATMVTSATTFGNMAQSWERSDVYRLLAATPNYGPSVDALRQSKILYLWTKDDQWESGTTMFHCEAHLAANTAKLRTDSYW